MPFKIEILKRDFSQLERLISGLNHNNFSREVLEEIQNLQCLGK